MKTEKLAKMLRDSPDKAKACEELLMAAIMAAGQAKRVQPSTAEFALILARLMAVVGLHDPAYFDAVVEMRYFLDRANCCKALTEEFVNVLLSAALAIGIPLKTGQIYDPADDPELSDRLDKFWAIIDPPKLDRFSNN
jgi:hypothetical protein